MIIKDFEDVWEIENQYLIKNYKYKKSEKKNANYRSE